MTVSNEPGYYENGNFGIRIENICISRYVDTPFHFGGKKSLGFETVTMVPIKTDLIDVGMLQDDEILWLNTYHAIVRDKLLPYMQESFPESVQYLLDNTNPIYRL
jgi:Xaa-Pro aminopeptidase